MNGCWIEKVVSGFIEPVEQINEKWVMKIIPLLYRPESGFFEFYFNKISLISRLIFAAIYKYINVFPIC